MAAAGFLAACPDMAAAVASGGGGGRGGGGGGGAHGGNPFDTVIVIDAGSSGCRLNIYQVEEEVRLHARTYAIEVGRFNALFFSAQHQGRSWTLAT